MSKTIRYCCSFFLVVALLSSLFCVSFAADPDNSDGPETAHVHSRELISIALEAVDGIHNAGEFRCSECGETYIDTITYEDLGLPLIDVSGSFDGMSKSNKVTVGFDYSDGNQSFSCNATFKWQGATSIQYPKKNYSISLIDESGAKKKVCFVDSWGKQSKYVLKANYIDYSQARNIVSAKLYGEIVRSRNTGHRIESLVNGGAIDGYPVVLFHDGAFLGLYTLNIPKDDWLFGMGDETRREAILFGDDWSDSVSLKEEMLENVEDSKWDIEYCSTEDTEGTGWISESFNRIIRFLNSCDKEQFNAHIGDYLDIDRAIDLYIFTVFMHANDNSAKNIIYATFDGDYWIPSAYDMDGTWGLRWNGEFSFSPTDYSFKSCASVNKLFELIYNYKYEELRARYTELREDILSVPNVKEFFSRFIFSIPELVYETEAEKWQDVPNIDYNNYDQILNFISRRVNYLDGKLDVRVVEKPSLSNKVTFIKDAGTEILVYDGVDLSSEPRRSVAGWTVNPKSGDLTKRNGILYFSVRALNGFALSDCIITPECDILTPDETGAEDVYAIVGVNEPVTIAVYTEEAEKLPFVVDFILPEGVSVGVYMTGDYSQPYAPVNTTFAVDPETGLPLTDGKGVVNFELIFDEGVELESFVVTPGEKAGEILYPDATGKENTFRITDITDNIEVYVYTNLNPAPVIEGYDVTFVHDENVSVYVYPKQDYTLTPVESDSAVSVDSDTGLPTVSGDGQVNFLVVLPENTVLKEIVIEPKAYKNLKGPEDTGLVNVYRITKITDDITVTITTENHVHEYVYTASETDPSTHVGVCSCGDTVTEPHTLSEEISVIGNTAFRVCEKCAALSMLKVGDYDMDNTISVSDARMVLRAAINLDVLEAGSALFAVSDVDGNNVVSVSDARMVLRASINLEDDLNKYHVISSPENESQELEPSAPSDNSGQEDTTVV